jgi:nucleoside-diphosphate-sugar epimerase
MTQISILGCGWLGFPLAKALIEKGFSVQGSTTSAEKLSNLQKSGIQAFLIALENNSISGDITTFLEGSKTLIIDIPPKLRGNSEENFIGKIETLIPFIEKSSIENVLFISSTSVYSEADLVVNEESLAQPETESGRQLLVSEQLLQNNTNFKTTILRFGGLIGEDRHPVKFLAGRENLDNPDAPINLIHQEDCIGIILKIIASHSWNEVFNAAAPFHPSREDYYTQKALSLNLVLPKFNTVDPSVGKTILSDKIENVLNYTFTKPNL